MDMFYIASRFTKGCITDTILIFNKPVEESQPGDIKILQSNSEKSRLGKDQEKRSFCHNYRIPQNEKGRRKTECSAVVLRIDKVEIQ